MSRIEVVKERILKFKTEKKKILSRFFKSPDDFERIAVIDVAIKTYKNELKFLVSYNQQ